LCPGSLALDPFFSIPAVVPGELLRSTAALLEQSACLRVSTLNKGVVLAVIVDKWKWVLATLTLGTVMLVATGAGIRAFAIQGATTRTKSPEHSGGADKPQVEK